MAIKLTKPEINWFEKEYQNGRTIEEMAIDTGFSKQNVKRALAEAGLVYLSWYKTTEEDKILKFLRSKNIITKENLKGALCTT